MPVPGAGAQAQQSHRVPWALVQVRGDDGLAPHRLRDKNHGRDGLNQPIDALAALLPLHMPHDVCVCNAREHLPVWAPPMNRWLRRAAEIPEHPKVPGLD